MFFWGQRMRCFQVFLQKFVYLLIHFWGEYGLVPPHISITSWGCKNLLWTISDGCVWAGLKLRSQTNWLGINRRTSQSILASNALPEIKRSWKTSTWSDVETLPAKLLAITLSVFCCHRDTDADPEYKPTRVTFTEMEFEVSGQLIS